MLSYRKETALHDVLVLAKSERLKLRDNNSGDFVGLYSTTMA